MRPGTPDPTSDNVYRKSVPVNTLPDGSLPPVLDPARWMTPDEAGAFLGVQGQRVRQIIRANNSDKSKPPIGTILGGRWLLSADDLGTILVIRRKESSKVATKRSVRDLAMDAVYRLASRLERCEKDLEEQRKRQFITDGAIVNMETRIVDCEQRVLEGVRRIIERQSKQR